MEQMTIPAEEQNGTVEEQVNPVAATTDATVATGTERAVAEFDLTTPEGARKFAAQHPAFTAVFADERNAERQRALRERDLEQGTQESVQAYHARLIDRLNSGEDPDVLAKETPQFYTAAQERSRIEMSQNLFNQAKALDPESVSALDPFAENASTGDQWASVAQAAMNAAANKSKSLGRDEFMNAETLDGIPEDAPIRKAIQAWHEQQLENDKMADSIEANRREIAPSTSGGTVSDGVDLSRFEGMSDAQAQTYMLELATSNPAEYAKVKDALLGAMFAR